MRKRRQYDEQVETGPPNDLELPERRESQLIMP
jgi:hypothetical protein